MWSYFQTSEKPEYVAIMWINSTFVHLIVYTGK